jgi:hypothetical protein
MVVEFSPQAIAFIMYGISLIIGVFAQVPGVVMICGIAAAAIGIFMFSVVGFWLAFLMMCIGGAVAVLGILPLFK